MLNKILSGANRWFFFVPLLFGPAWASNDIIGPVQIQTLTISTNYAVVPVFDWQPSPNLSAGPLNNATYLGSLTIKTAGVPLSGGNVAVAFPPIYQSNIGDPGKGKMTQEGSPHPRDLQVYLSDDGGRSLKCDAERCLLSSESTGENHIVKLWANESQTGEAGKYTIVVIGSVVY
ncbi:hypothetical protein [Serratia sp. 2723]|uniref:hypothetical protein n=1 Tax=unclassified Serratia (in: enterobacteria) TaxID=2647522 RepID=UPI003D197C21